MSAQKIAQLLFNTNKQLYSMKKPYNTKVCVEKTGKSKGDKLGVKVHSNEDIKLNGKVLWVPEEKLVALK